MLEVEGLAVAHGSLDVVSDISFSLARGAALAIVGPSGSGKSSIISALARLLPDGSRAGGRVSFDGRDLFSMPIKEARKLIGVVFQEPALALDPLMRAGNQLAEAAGADKVLPALAELGFDRPEEIARAFPHQLSGGMRQRVLIAMALAREPQLLLCDEPTAQLDAITRAEVLRKIDERRRAKNMTLIYATHDQRLVASFCEHTLVLSR